MKRQKDEYVPIQGSNRISLIVAKKQNDSNRITSKDDSIEILKTRHLFDSVKYWPHGKDVDY